jgi:N-acetylneuraminate synthase/sialic acid synthase
MNLRVIEDYRHQYPDTVVGLSTHNPSWYPSLVAYGLGARIFEHHYTNNRKWKGTDNHFSLTPPDLAEFVGALEEAREAMGSRVKIQYPAERAPTTERQKSLVWASQVLQYEEITREDIKIQCPGDGIPPYYIDLIVGGLAAYTVGRGERIGWQDVLVGARGEREFQEAVVSV